MNAVEIEEAVSELALQPFDADEFPFDFLLAFGNPEATIKRLRKGATNKSDVGGVLQRNNIHIAVAKEGELDARLAELRDSPQTAKAKAKFILATDGKHVAAEELVSGEPLACDFEKLGHNFGFFLPLAGISTVAEIKNNPIDVRATGRLNKLYVELLKIDPDWATTEKRPHLNRFMARLIFCFFAEDTGIFNGDDLFTNTVRTMTEADGTNTHEVLEELFRTMNLDGRKGERDGVKSWADVFPFVNGGLFKDEIECPRFNRTARAYLIRAGELDWKTINPDIFGSMIQAVADDDERGSLGMHYTSVPNIEKVLNPLFLDDLRGQLEEAGTNKRKLLNLRKRLSSVRIFDPACGSGNFLVIAYIRLREIEAELMRRRGEAIERSWVKLTQFYGIELKSFAAEIARLSLLIAEFQSDVRFIGQTEARALVLPLHETGEIRSGNALAEEWTTICPPCNGPVIETDLAGPTGRLNLDDGHVASETFICGNPPYLGSKWQTDSHKSDMSAVFSRSAENWKGLDYVAAWFEKASRYLLESPGVAGFVATNSICQGQQVAPLWRPILARKQEIKFAHNSFKWSNLAARNAGVTVVVVGISQCSTGSKMLYSRDPEGNELSASVSSISPYLVPGAPIFVEPRAAPLSDLPTLARGNSPTDGGNLVLSVEEAERLNESHHDASRFIRPFIGSAEYINAQQRFCVWIEEEDLALALSIPEIKSRIDKVKEFRLESKKAATRKAAQWPYRFDERKAVGAGYYIVAPVVSSENRPYLPCGLLDGQTIISNKVFGASDAPLWLLALLTSRLMLVWVATVCARMRTDFSFTNTLGWNTFPLPRMTESALTDLTRCSEEILLAREASFPASLADLYSKDSMPTALASAHQRNDETLERIYIGRRFRNDTERLEKLFELYSRIIAKKAA